jgi:hypothetical protein
MHSRNKAIVAIVAIVTVVGAVGGLRGTKMRLRLKQPRDTR